MSLLSEFFQASSFDLANDGTGYQPLTCIISEMQIITLFPTHWLKVEWMMGQSCVSPEKNSMVLSPVDVNMLYFRGHKTDRRRWVHSIRLTHSEVDWWGWSKEMQCGPLWVSSSQLLSWWLSFSAISSCRLGREKAASSLLTGFLKHSKPLFPMVDGLRSGKGQAGLRTFIS